MLGLCWSIVGLGACHRRYWLCLNQGEYSAPANLKQMSLTKGLNRNPARCIYPAFEKLDKLDEKCYKSYSPSANSLRRGTYPIT